MKDSQFLPEKLSNKVAKEIFERFQEYERIYQKVFAGIFAAARIYLVDLFDSYFLPTLLYSRFCYRVYVHVRWDHSTSFVGKN